LPRPHDQRQKGHAKGTASHGPGAAWRSHCSHGAVSLSSCQAGQAFILQFASRLFGVCLRIGYPKIWWCIYLYRFI
jgi:hypothetical protein